jgi:hypothetical protein
LISSNEEAVAWGICHTEVIKTEDAIAIATTAVIAVDVFFLLVYFFIFVILFIIEYRAEFFL